MQVLKVLESEALEMHEPDIRRKKRLLFAEFLTDGAL